MRTTAKTILTAALAALVSVAVPSAALSAGPWDINGNWAARQIAELVNQGTMEGYPDGSFRPDRAVTRAEFARIAAKAMDLAMKGTHVYSDVPRQHWANTSIGALTEKGVVTGYPDGSFGPDRTVTRAEAAAILTRLVAVADKPESYVQPMLSNFSDVPPENWSFKYVESARKLGIIPIHMNPSYLPMRPITRAETAYMVESLTNLQITRGKLLWVDPYAKTLSVDSSSQADQVGSEQSWLRMSPLTTLFRNNVTTTPDSLITGDTIYAITNTTGEPLYVKAYGPVTKTDVLNKASALTSGRLTPYQIQSLIKGDWDAVKTDLSATLLSRLIDSGLKYEEAQSIITKDWGSLQGQAKDRVASVLSDELGVTPELMDSLVAKDWKQAGEMAKGQLAQVLLSKLMAL